MTLHPTMRLARVHAPDLLAHFAALSDDDLRLRFGRVMNGAALLAYVQGIDFARDAVFGVIGRELGLLGVAHLSRGQGGGELGVSVLPARRGSGVGYSLLGRARLHAAALGLGVLQMNCLSENEPMKRLARQAGFTLASQAGDTEARLVIAQAPASALLADWIEERMGLAHASYLAQSRVANLTSEAFAC